MKTNDDRELKSTSKKIFNKTNHIIKTISCLFLSMFILCLPLSFCVPVNAETIDDDIVMTDNTSNDSTKQETKKSDTQTNEHKVIRVGSFEDTFMSMKTVSDEALATNSCRLLPAMLDGNSST